MDNNGPSKHIVYGTIKFYSRREFKLTEIFLLVTDILNAVLIGFCSSIKIFHPTKFRNARNLFNAIIRLYLAIFLEDRHQWILALAFRTLLGLNFGPEMKLVTS